MKKELEALLAKEYQGISGYFRAKKDAKEISIVKPLNKKELFFTIGHYQWYLTKKIMPEIGSILFLLFTCAAAFLLSFTTIRQQYRLSEQKNDFISNMSHELKTPVATAQIALEALARFEALKDPVKTKDYLHIATWEIKRLEILVMNVLNNARLEEGRISLHKESVLLNDLLHELAQQFAPVCEEQNKRIDLDIIDEPIYIRADRLHLQGALYNIIDNAIKYGDRTIAVFLTTSPTSIEIGVEDDGTGVSHEYREKIFEKFFRIPTGNEHLIKGYGLGLHYAQYVVKEHEGFIKVQKSEKIGGTKFIVSFTKVRSS